MASLRAASIPPNRLIGIPTGLSGLFLWLEVASMMSAETHKSMVDKPVVSRRKVWLNPVV